MRVSEEEGQVLPEALGMLPFLLVVFALLCQVTLAGLSHLFAAHAASVAGRAYATGESDEHVRRLVEDDLPGAWEEGLSIELVEDSVEVAVRVPALLPSLEMPWQASGRAGVARESGAAGGELGG